jgi:phenylpyruvate tautomerase PptA (4-oxalocrotonate tautomerase family)
MPIGYLDVPTGADTDQKRQLMMAVYGALHEAWPFPDDVRIFIREWPLESVSQNGILGSEPVRPVLTLHIPQGGNADIKRKVLEKISAAVVSAYRLPDFMTFLVEYPLDLVAHEGHLLADTR